MTIPTDRPNLQLEPTTAGLVVHLIDCRSLNEQTTPAIEAQLLTLADEVGAGALLLDLGNIYYASSIALGMLINLRQKLRGGGGRLTVFGVNEEIYDVIDATRLTHLLDIHREAPPTA
jgi:anti-anti-sigma factor